MKIESTLVDTNVLVDIFTEDRHWFEWSKQALNTAEQRGSVVIPPAVYAELAVPFPSQKSLDAALSALRIQVIESPMAGLYSAAKAFSTYRARGGKKSTVLPDFFIGGHAESLNIPLLSRDAARYRSYFPKVALITPDTH